MKQFHLTFQYKESPEIRLLYIVRAENREKAIEQIKDQVQNDFLREHNIYLDYETHSEFFDLETYPLTDIQVKELILSNPDRVDGEKLGRLIVWFNDRELKFIISLFDKNLSDLRNLERNLFPCEINIDENKLKLLRGFLDKEYGKC